MAVVIDAFDPVDIADVLFASGSVVAVAVAIAVAVVIAAADVVDAVAVGSVVAAAAVVAGSVEIEVVGRAEEVMVLEDWHGDCK